MDELTTISSCEGCGACCRWQGAPPDYVALALNDHFQDDPSFADDFQRFQNLPEKAKELLDTYLLKFKENSIDKNGPCVWLDENLEYCLFYDHRPSSCRSLAVGDGGCIVYRKMFGIDPSE
ncbi:Flagellin N-methylase [Thalassoglobus neptunius]|uniref:Flagellin N-methylase n=1 Tax=Thalassoglobus neptunius TaxID=1938619 RepID=A0A5C5X6I5_9PLAN|nr:YkgJ family cysteine cluster protein [Thalassoglobus neptunius]TWT58727.1 Flagellin N-methylase [Thalassoglobus neptunius]